MAQFGFGNSGSILAGSTAWQMQDQAERWARLRLQHAGPLRCRIGTLAINADLVTEGTPISPATDLASFDRRFVEVRERVLRICVGLVGPDNAEDVIHDVYLRTRQRIGQLADPERFEAWVARSAVRLCYNHHRSQRRLRDRLPRIASHQPAATDRDFGLRELIERLPLRERMVVVLYYGHGYQTDEVATLIGTSPGNARSILFRARHRLAAQLGEPEL